MWSWAVIGGILTLYHAGLGIASYAEWQPRLTIGFKPSAPDIFKTEFSLKNDGKFSLTDVNAEALLLWFEYDTGNVLAAETFGKVSWQNLLSSVGDIRPGDTRYTRPIIDLIPETF